MTAGTRCHSYSYSYSYSDSYQRDSFLLWQVHEERFYLGPDAASVLPDGSDGQQAL